MQVQVILTLEVGTKEAAYDVVSKVVESSKCYSFEIKDEEQVKREREIQDELIEHVKASCKWEEDFEDALTACGFTPQEVKAIVAEHR